MQARELDYVRQCAADLVEAIPVHKDADDQHNALEQAVCGLTPRIKAVSIYLFSMKAQVHGRK